MSTSIRPMNDFVFVLKESKERVSAGGIVLGEQEYDTGRVVAVGPGKLSKRGRRDSMWSLAPGQLIAFSPNGNWRQKVDGEDLTVIRRDSVIGIVEGVAA